MSNRATIIRQYTPDLAAVAVNGKVAVATRTKGGVLVESTDDLTTEETASVVALIGGA